MRDHVLGETHAIKALASMDREDFGYANVPVAAFADGRPEFPWRLAGAGRLATDIFDDFAGTARARQRLAG